MTRYQLRAALFLVSILLLAQCRTAPIQSEGERQAIQHSTPVATTETQGASYLSSNLRMPGEYMRVFDIAYSAFLVDDNIPADKRRVENYRIELHQDDSNYKITFIAKRKPPELGQMDGGESHLGKEVTYTVNKKTYQVAHATFYK